MLTSKSRDGVYSLSAPDNSKHGSPLQLSVERKTEKNYDNIQDVYLEVMEGKEVNLSNLARAITYDCFSYDGRGLQLLAHRLRCHVKTLERIYEFEVDEHSYFVDILESLGYQIKL